MYRKPYSIKYDLILIYLCVFILGCSSFPSRSKYNVDVAYSNMNLELMGIRSDADGFVAFDFILENRGSESVLFLAFRETDDPIVETTMLEVECFIDEKWEYVGVMLSGLRPLVDFAPKRVVRLRLNTHLKADFFTTPRLLRFKLYKVVSPAYQIRFS